MVPAALVHSELAVQLILRVGMPALQLGALWVLWGAHARVALDACYMPAVTVRATFVATIDTDSTHSCSQVPLFWDPAQV